PCAPRSGALAAARRGGRARCVAGGRQPRRSLRRAARVGPGATDAARRPPCRGIARSCLFRRSQPNPWPRPRCETDGDAMMGGLHLAPAKIADIGAVMRVMEAAFDPAYGEAWSSAQMLTLFALPSARVALAWDGEAPCGFYAARVAGPESELL